MSNTNFQTFHQMGSAINNVVRQATGRDNVQNIDMNYVTVAQNKRRVERVVTGDVASFYADSDSMLDYVIARINPVQTGSGDPSPENIRPISGWTGCNVTRTGKNLLNPNLTYESGYWGMNGSVVSSANYKRELEYIPVNGNTSYAFQMNKTASTSRILSICEYDGNKAFIEYTIVIPSTASTTGVVSGTIFTKESTKYIRINVPAENVSNIQFEENADATEYEAYAGEEYAITFPSSAGTVYGGTLTVNKDGTGTLVVNHVKHEMPTSGFSLLYTRDAVCVFSRQRNDVWDEKPVGLQNGTVISNLLKAIPTVNSSTDTPYTFSIYNTSNNYIRIALPPSVASTAEQLHTWLTNNPVEVVYEITEPVTYQLTALEVIEMMEGINNIWADTGDITVMYSCYEEVV